MQSTIQRYVDIHPAVVILGLIGLLFCMKLVRAVRRRTAQKKQYRHLIRYQDAADQLRIVMGASFKAQPLLNGGETRVFKELDRLVAIRNPGWRVMAQVSLGEILLSDSIDAYGCINAKRIDMLLIDENCQPRHAIEYQGAGHYQSTAAARDAVKKEALRQAGIGYHEVIAGHTTPSDLKGLIEKLVNEPKADH